MSFDDERQDAAAPGLDLLLLSEVRRLVGEAERYTAAGMHAVAVPDARRALRALALVLAKHDQKTLLVRLVSDREPLLSPDRDTRPGEPVTP